MFERGSISSGERAKLADDEHLLQRSEYWLDGGGFKQPCRLPVAEPDFANAWAGTELACDRHQHDIRFAAIIGEIAHDDGGAPF